LGARLALLRWALPLPLIFICRRQDQGSGTPEKAFPEHGGTNGGIGCGDVGVGDVGSVFIDKGGIGAFPGYDAPAAIAELDE
jgi:hypothetical protein